MHINQLRCHGCNLKHRAQTRREQRKAARENRNLRLCMGCKMSIEHLYRNRQRCEPCARAHTLQKKRARSKSREFELLGGGAPPKPKPRTSTKPTNNLHIKSSPLTAPNLSRPTPSNSHPEAPSSPNKQLPNLTEGQIGATFHDAITLEEWKRHRAEEESREDAKPIIRLHKGDSYSSY